MDSSIPATALRTLILAFPHPNPIQGASEGKSVQDAFDAISKVLIPRLLGYVVIAQGSRGVANPTSGMLDIDPQRGANSDALEVVIELLRHFGPMLRDPERLGFQTKLLQILDDKRTTNIVKKKVITALSLLAIYLSDAMLEAFMSKLLEGLRSRDLQRKKYRLLLNVLGSLSRTISSKIGLYLPNLVPLVLKALSQAELEQSIEAVGEDGGVDADSEEVKEAALVTLEALLSSCGLQMCGFTPEVIDASLRFVTYNPALITEDDDDEEMEGAGDDEDGDTEINAEEEDFEEEAGMSDDDDGSWKIRRGAAKVLYAVISAHQIGDEPSIGRLFERVAPILVKGFKDREESVRLEVLIAMAMLVKKAGEDPSIALLPVEEEAQPASSVTKSRKRRRGGSDASMFDAPHGGSPLLGIDSRTGSPAPASSPKYDLSKYSPGILSGATKLLLSKSLPTIQASTIFLRDFALLRPGGLSEHLGQIIPPVVDLATGSGTSSLSMTNGASGGISNSTTLRLDCLQLLATLCETHNTKTLAPYAGKIAAGLLSAVKDPHFKVSSSALRTVESFVVILTPVELSGHEGHFQQHFSALSDAVVGRLVLPESDLEVRQRAISTLGTMLGRSLATPGNSTFTHTKQRQALDTLFDRLKLEITRLDSVQAIDTIASSLGDEVVLDDAWVRKVSLELAAQLRKADRVLRGSSLNALRRLLKNTSSRGQLDDTTIRQLIQMLLPLIVPSGLEFLSPTLDSVAYLTKQNPRIVVDQHLNDALCTIVLTSLSGHVMESFLLMIKAVGESGTGQPLMGDFLQKVGVHGDPAVVGAAIGTLLVSGGSTIRIRTHDFMTELQTAQDDKRKCLALSVLGEASLRLGTASPITPATFTDQFSSKSDQVRRAAAIALGRASSGNVSKHIPIILGLVDKAGSKQYLLLHTIKELLQCVSKARIDISSYTAGIWKTLSTSSAQEDNKALGSECIGRLIGVEPRRCLPILQVPFLLFPQHPIYHENIY